MSDEPLVLVYVPDPPLLSPITPYRAATYRPGLLDEQDPDLPDLHEQPIKVPASTLARWEQALALMEQVQDELREAKGQADALNEQALAERLEVKRQVTERREAEQRRRDIEFWGPEEFRVVDRHAYNGEAWSSNTRDLGSTIHRQSCKALARVTEPSEVSSKHLRWDEALTHLMRMLKVKDEASYDTREYKACKFCCRDLHTRVETYRALNIGVVEALDLERQKPTEEQIRTLAALYRGLDGQARLLAIA